MPLPFTASRWQVTTYLFGVALFSISFLVFLNSSISFVVTDRIGQRTAVGNVVGTLGFADELVALVACPTWGIISDRVGVRAVTVAGYVIVGLSLAILVMSRNVYPELLLGRLLFSLGGSATAVMVTAILSSMTSPTAVQPSIEDGRPLSANGYNITPSISSELTVTPERYMSSSSTLPEEPKQPDIVASTSQLAGLVGMFTGFGALLALLGFLPLPARFQKSGNSPAESITYSFWIVGAVAIFVALACFVGLRNLPGEQKKGWHRLFTNDEEVDKRPEAAGEPKAQATYAVSLKTSFILGFQDVNIGLGYLGGFVARASTVAVSLFIPLFVNAYFLRSGICDANPNHPGAPTDPGEIKRRCAQAYVVAAKLTGTSQLVALICAPVFGYFSGRFYRYNVPLLLATFAGIAGYTAFGFLKSPDPASPDGSASAYFIVALLGISQIGAIVCSLGQLGRGIQDGGSATDTQEADHHDTNATAPNTSMPDRRSLPAVAEHDSPNTVTTESTSLLPSHLRQVALDSTPDRAQLKGSIAGLYSLAGGAGILILTKAGGVMFDRIDASAPFWLMAAFNGLLFIGAAGCAVKEFTRTKWEQWDGRLPEENGNIVTTAGESRSGDG